MHYFTISHEALFFFQFIDLLLVKNIQRTLAIVETGYKILSTLGLNS